MLAPLLLLVAAAQAYQTPTTSGAPTRHSTTGAATTEVAVTVDSTRGEVKVTVGPLHFDPIPPGFNTGHEMPTIRTPMFRWEWPVDGWIRGFRLTLRDAHGEPLSRDLMHFILVNFSRRQLVHRGAERLMGAARETEDVDFPASLGIGVPMSRGMQLGLYAKRHYETPEPLDSVYIEVAFPWTPLTATPRLADAVPFYVDAYLTVGALNEFDVPPGRSEQSRVFSVPAGGRLWGVAGHLHRYGAELRLEDAATGRVLATLAATQDAEGRITRLERRVFGLRSEVRLEASHPYRLVGAYRNPTDSTLHQFAMAHMVGLFLPDDPREVPRLDLSDPIVQTDIASLAREGAVAERKMDDRR